jgi:type II restriction/modification system DNA methylase subunit YeeA
MVEHYEKTGKYELVVEEPWFTKMMNFKNNWDNEIAQNYVEEIKDQLDYLENYRNEMIERGLG